MIFWISKLENVHLILLESFWIYELVSIFSSLIGDSRIGGRFLFRSNFRVSKFIVSFPLLKFDYMLWIDDTTDFESLVDRFKIDRREE